MPDTSLPKESPPLVRCRACQLQLCKGRNEPPHAALTAIAPGGGRMESERSFTCNTCGITMVNSPDLAQPGWRHVRR